MGGEIFVDDGARSGVKDFYSAIAVTIRESMFADTQPPQSLERAFKRFYIPLPIG